MTCIIGYIDKKNNKVYMGADSCASNKFSKQTLYKGFKMFKPEKNKNIIIGITGSIRPFQILKYNIDFPTEEDLTYNKAEFDEKTIINKLIPKIQSALIDGKCGDKGADLDWSCLMIAYKDKLFILEDNFGLIECSNYKAIGSGQYHAEGCLFSLEDSKLSITDKIHKGLQSATNFAIGVDKPFYIINTADDEILEFEE
jgi:ATP-dependent protease HslVU (ClpYQ) peptidase subunit